jgi:hypothetical protein
VCAFGPLNLKPWEFWKLQPKDIILMNEGLELKRAYDRSLHIEHLHLQRSIVATIRNIGQAFSKHPKFVDVMDVWPIEEMDVVLRKQQKEMEDLQEQRANAALLKHQEIERKLKERKNVSTRSHSKC